MRYTLRAIVAVVFVILLMLNGRMSFHIREERAEHRAAMAKVEQTLMNLRGRVGSLDVTEPKKFYVQRILSGGGPMHWRWRIYVPASRTYRLHAAFEDIPPTGLPASGMMVGGRTGSYLHQGEGVYHAALTRGGISSKWHLRVTWRGENGGFITGAPAWGLSEEQTHWYLRSQQGWDLRELVEPGEVHVTDETPLVLVRMRSNEPGESESEDDLRDGLMLWIE